MQFWDDWHDFRVAELLQLMKLFNIDGELLESPPKGMSSDVFQYMEIPSAEAAAQLCSRSVLIKSIYEVWTHGETFLNLTNSLKELSNANTSSVLPGTLPAGESWHVEVVPLYKSMKIDEKERCRAALSFLVDRFGDMTPHPKNASLTVCLVADYHAHKQAIAASTFVETDGANVPTVACFCGRLLGRGGMKEELTKYQLKKRLFLGPTSLDHVLSMLMCNLAGVQRRHMVLDPFVGTASLLVAASHLKAYCMGSDIDIRVLKGGMYAGASRDSNAKKAAETGARTSRKVDGGEKIRETATSNSKFGGSIERTTRENFHAYGLTPPEIVRMDLHNIEKHMDLVPAGGEEGMFHCIVTDPPYGIRAGGRKTGRSDGLRYEITADRRNTHIPATQNYPVEEVMLDLLHAAAKVLVHGGTLCYLIPTPYDFVNSDLPSHPCFELEQVCVQNLSTRHGRSAVLLRKVCAYTDEHQKAFAEYSAAVMRGDDEQFGALMGKLERALAPSAHEDTEVVKRKSNTFERRKASKQAKADRKHTKEQRLLDPTVKPGAVILVPEEQHALYLAIRDGDMVRTTSLLKLGGRGDIAVAANSSPFEALWHEPGPEATPLHLAAACLQPEVVEFLLKNGANPNVRAGGRRPTDVVDSIDLFAPARAQRPQDLVKVKALLQAAEEGGDR